MTKKDDNQMPSTFPSKWAKVLKDLPEFRDITDSAGTDDLKKIIFQCEGNIYTIEKAKDEDTDLQSRKEAVKEALEPYNDSIKVQTAKIKYALFLLEGKGVDLDHKD